MIKSVVGLIAGIAFGIGLSVSQMTNPQKVLNFLDISANWDGSLALVMLSALSVAAIGFFIAKKLNKPMFAARFNWPDKTIIDKRLVIGASLFGIGWGIIGLCPGPAIASLAAPSFELMVFLVSMIMGMAIARKIS